jgi:hypothetical protein
MYETRSWHTYSYHLVFFGKSGVTTTWVDAEM